MNEVGVQADVTVPPSRPQSSSYLNFRSNLSSLVLSIIPASSQFLNRFKKAILINLSSSSMSEDDDGWQEMRLAAAAQTARELKVQALPSFPSPWGFLTSGYMVGLMITAILLHRIQNVVIPSPRRNTRYRTSFPYATTITTTATATTISTLWERLHASILPLDFSRTATRFLLHFPSVCFLFKMLVIWIVLVFQTCQVPLVFGVVVAPLGEDGKVGVGVVAYVGAILERLARWAVDQEMTRICWSTFWAVCAAFLVEGFIKAMDGLGGGGGGGGGGALPLGGGGVNSLSPFHLVSYAFLLHIYSSPLAHGFHPVDDSPSRPDKHVVITITIALLQLSIFHVLSISKRLSRHRLIPTAVASFLSLIHFHTTVFYHLMATPTTTGRTTAARQSIANNSSSASARYMAVGATYPLLNYVPNLFETTLLVTILLTVTVNAVAQLLVRGRVDHVLSGLGIFSGLPNDDGTNSGFFANLPYEEDFIIVLMRIGVASLEATGLRGWNNEVAPIIQRPKITPRRVQWSKKGRLSGEEEEDTYGQVRMGRMGVVARVQYGTTTTASMVTGTGATSVVARTRAMMGWNGRRDGYEEMNRTKMTKKTKKKKTMTTTRIRRGFDNDVRIIDLGQAGGSSSGGLMSGSWNRSIVVVVAFWQFLVVFGGVLWGLGALVLDGVRRRVSGDSGRRGKRRSSGRGESEGLEERDVGDEWGEEELMNEDGGLADDEVYQRFLRGEDISDDDDEGDAMEGSSDEEMSEEEDDEEGQEREGEVVDLFTDLLRNPDVEGEDCRMVGGPVANGSSGEMALAHLLHGSVSSSSSSRPLTRRVWNGLFRRRGYLDGQDDEDDDRGGQALEEDHDRYYYNNRGVEERDREKGVEHVCVVCMLETREVICWPCRCLAMCDGCRGRLAMRTSASKHRCPCCRQIVDGYSKIYIP